MFSRIPELYEFYDNIREEENNFLLNIRETYVSISKLSIMSKYFL